MTDHGLGPFVVDPVLVTSHGDLLLEVDAMGVLRRLLLPLAAVVTPNIPEAEALLSRPIERVTAMEEAAAELASLGPAAVLLKGGHLGGDRSPDVLWQNGRAEWLDAPRQDARHTHGTGCTLSAAICAATWRSARPCRQPARAPRSSSPRPSPPAWRWVGGSGRSTPVGEPGRPRPCRGPGDLQTAALSGRLW